MHSSYVFVGLLTFIIQGTSASFSLGDSNGESQTETKETPAMVQTPVMYASPLMATVPVSPIVQYGISPPRSEVRNLVGSYAREEGHLSDTMLDLPFRRARARKLAARKARMHKKSLKKHRKVNKQ